MSRRLTSDRFYGGVDDRVANLQMFLSYLRRENPTVNETAAWLDSELGGTSETTRDRYLSFLRGLKLVEQAGSHLYPGSAGLRYLRSPHAKVLFAVLDDGVAGFDLILEALATGYPLTDEQLRQVLNAGPYGHDMDGPGVAIRHREWIQALGFARRKRDPEGQQLTELTSAGHDLWKAYDHDSLSRYRPKHEQQRSDLPLGNIPGDPLPDSIQEDTQTNTFTKDISYPAPIASQRTATSKHQAALSQLRDQLEERGCDVKKSKYSDLIAYRDPTETILLFEIKSITKENAWDQVRKAVGQVLEYKYTDIKQREELSEEVRPGILLNQQPPTKVEGYLKHLSETTGIWIVWIEDGFAGPSNEALQSYLDGK